MLNDFISLLFPKLCSSCGKSLFRYEKSLCTYCHYHLPRTNFHVDNANPVAKIFWGRIKIHSAAAFYAFGKGGRVQRLIHELKYKGNKEVGITVGTAYGYELRKTPDFAGIDLIIPVPLHRKKYKKRGYNQSELFATGLSKSMKIKTDFTNLYRRIYSATQTRKSRFSRWQNVESVFAVRDPSRFRGRHILLVDDVITTGATLEACAQVLLEIENVTVSIACIAYAAN